MSSSGRPHQWACIRGERVDGRFRLRQRRADDLVADVVVDRQVLQEEEESSVVVLDGGVARRCGDRCLVEYVLEHLDLAVVQPEHHGHFEVRRFGARHLRHDRVGGAAAAAVDLQVELCDLAEDAGALADVVCARLR